MKIEAFLLCDAATDSAGKLNVLGAFDVINAIKEPVVHPFFSVAIRIRFDLMEQGDHHIQLKIEKENEREHIAEINGNVGVKIENQTTTGVVNLIFNFQGITFKTFGAHRIALRVDDQEIGGIPLFIRHNPQNVKPGI